MFIAIFGIFWFVYWWMIIIKVARYKRYKRSGGVRSSKFWTDFGETFKDISDKEIGFVVGATLGYLAIPPLLYFSYRRLKK